MKSLSFFILVKEEFKNWRSWGSSPNYLLYNKKNDHFYIESLLRNPCPRKQYGQKKLILRKTKNKFLKTLFFPIWAFRKTYVISLNLMIKSINYSAFESRHLALSNEL